MKCEKCSEKIENNAAYEFKGRELCDDCYIDLMIGVPDLDITKLSPEIQAQFIKVMNGWQRKRPNQHHYLKFPSS